MADLTLPRTVAHHLAYHSRMASSFAAAGNVDECASEALLAWTILTSHGEPDVIDALSGDLPEPETLGATPQAQDAARRRAHALALGLQGHFVSEGQTDSATLYERVASSLHLP